MQNTADAAVVWLHGRGEKGTGARRTSEVSQENLKCGSEFHRTRVESHDFRLAWHCSYFRVARRGGFALLREADTNRRKPSARSATVRSDWTFFRYSTKEVLPRVEWTFPTAPEQWVTCDDSELMTAWFDIATIPVNPVRGLIDIVCPGGKARIDRSRELTRVKTPCTCPGMREG